MKHGLYGWHVYLVECVDGSYYCGISNDVDRRLQQHNSGMGAKYTRGRQPVTLLCAVSCLTRGDALRLEYSVKKLKRKEKLQFLRGQEKIKYFREVV